MGLGPDSQREKKEKKGGAAIVKLAPEKEHQNHKPKI